jgi:predicted nucleic acid-binding protein
MIVDTGILYALIDRRDRHHRAARAVFALPEPRIVPEPVIVETDLLVLSNLGVEQELRFLRGLGEPAFLIESPGHADRARAAEVAAQYRDLEIGYVDAVVVAIAERLRDRRIATVDRRDFSAIRPRHAEAFELLP